MLLLQCTTVLNSAIGIRTKYELLLIYLSQEEEFWTAKVAFTYSPHKPITIESHKNFREKFLEVFQWVVAAAAVQDQNIWITIPYISQLTLKKSMLITAPM